MQTVIGILQSLTVFVAGIGARLGLFLAMLAVLVLPALAAALAIRAVSERRRKALGLRQVAGLQFRPDVFYAPSHSWLHRRASGALEIGLDDLAMRLLPSVTAVELPRPGTSLRRGEPVATLYGGGRALRIPAPVGGHVVGTNGAVMRDPGLVKRDGYGRGWLVAISPADESFATLPMGELAESWTRREAARWTRYLEDKLGFAAADGGDLVSPAPWLVGEDGWSALTHEFLGA